MTRDRKVMAVDLIKTQTLKAGMPRLLFKIFDALAAAGDVAPDEQRFVLSLPVRYCRVLRETPLLSRGRVDSTSRKNREAPCWSGRGGVDQETLAITTPSERSKVASRLLFDRAATPPQEIPSVDLDANAELLVLVADGLDRLFIGKQALVDANCYRLRKRLRIGDGNV